MEVALRTDKDFSAIKEWISSKDASGFAVKETAGEDNVHYHWYIKIAGFKNLQSFRVQFTKKFLELKGNGAYSCKMCDEDVERYFRYMCKGSGNGQGAEVVWSNGILWTPEKFEALHEEYWAENVRVPKRKKLEPIIDIVIEKLKEDGTAWTDRERIAKAYIRELYNRDRSINIYSVKSVVNLIQIKIAPVADKAIADLAQYASGY